MRLRYLVNLYMIGLALATLCWASPREAQFPPQIHTETLALAREVEERFPPDQFIYVGLGQSPSLLMAALSLNSPIYHLPLSKVGWLREELLSNAVAPYGGHRGLLSRPQRLARLWQHMGEFLPSRQQIQSAHRRVLVIDFAATGASLRGAEALLNLFWQDVPVEVLALTVKSLEFRNQIVLNERYPELAKLLSLQPEIVGLASAYGGYHLSHHPGVYQSPMANPNFQRVRQWLSRSCSTALLLGNG